MNTKSIIALCFLFTLMFAGIGYIYYNVLEYEIISKDDGFTSEAQKNRFLLSQIFLETGGHNISTEKNISDLPIGFNSNTDVVISTIANPVTVRKDIHKLEIWIKKGGTYIISMSDTQLEAGAMNEDHFANYFNVELTHIKQPKNLSSSNRRFDCVASHSNTQSNDDMFIPEMVEKIKDRLNIQEEDRFSTIHSDYTSFKTLYPKDNDLSIYPDYEEYDELIYYGDYERYYLIKYNYGEGAIWFNFSNEIFNNEYLSCGDHAKLLDHLVDDKKNIVFLSHISYTSFINILFEYAIEALILSAILFSLICWYFMNHLYQHRTMTSNSAPKFSLHIQAISHLIKRENSIQDHILELIAHILEKVNLILVDYSHDELINFIQAKTKLEPELIEFALSNTKKNTSNTTKQIILLQTIRKTL